jgi:PKD repeat protein
MKVLGKITLTLGLMIIVSLFLTSCSGGGLVTPELQLDPDEYINKPEKTVVTADAGLDQSKEVYPSADALVNFVGSGTGTGTLYYAWDLDNDGQFDDSIEQDPQDIPFGVGVHLVRLRVTDDCDSAIDTITVTITESLGYVYLDVPYEKYAGANWCLPASGAMTFKYFGENISQAEIANAVIKDGTSSVYKMVKYAKDLGFEAKYNYMTIEEIKYLLSKDIPVIAVQNYSLTLPYSHARVIIGYDDEEQEVISNDPTAGKDYKMSYSNFTALNTGINPDLFKVLVIATEDIDTKNAVLIDDTNNS